MSDSKVSNLEREILIDVEKYSAGANAWYNTSLEHDKSILTLSTLGIGLLITLITSFGVESAEALTLNLLAILSFMISIAAVLIIFKKNGSYLNHHLDALERPTENSAPVNNSMLSILDNIVITTFAMGMIFSSILGISAAVNSYTVNTTKEKIVTNDNQTKTESLRESFNQSPLEKKSYNQAPIKPVEKPAETVSTTKQDVKK